MRHSGRYRGHAVRGGRAENLGEALAALSLEELRTFVSDALERLDDGPRASLEDLLLQRAARSTSGWRPAAPSVAFVEEARSFAAAARRVGQAAPSEVDDFLRKALTASLAGNHSSARAVFEALLDPIGNGDIFLGQDEMVDEVLSVDLYECARRFVTAVYMTTPLAERAKALIEASDTVSGLSYLDDPIEEVVAALGGNVPDLDAFLPLWVARLEGDAGPGPGWESNHERWLRAAVGRREGAAGLARIARTTRSVQAARAWCEALVAEGAWPKALAAYEECAALVERDFSRGDFLDGAALAAHVLGRKDVVKKLEAAWLGAPSLLRLSRWLLAEEPASATVRKRAALALDASPTKAPRLIGFLDLLAGQVSGAARALAKAPGLGWSRSEHPGHVLFPTFAWLLGGAPSGSVREELASTLHPPIRDELDWEGAFDDGAQARPGPRLPSPSLIDVLQRAGIPRRLSRDDRKVMLDAMKTAAEQRTDGVLGGKRRRHYGHAATLVACCVELEDGSGKANEASFWAEALRTRTSRFPAFQEALRAALAKARRLA